jgi:N-methylhydantoinase A/oxoprolinase/acetone carboxylase beta subunit
MLLLGVDVGGTFTDAVLASAGSVFTAKSPTTPDDQSEGVLAAIIAVLAKAGASADQIDRFAHGMTVGTNALLEGHTSPAALIATEGFTDVVELARQNRPELYRLQARGPSPLIGPELRIGARERMTPEGTLRALTPEEVGRLVVFGTTHGVSAVAVVLLHSYRHPEHERAIAEAFAAQAPEISVHLSSELVGTFREYERAATTELDAAISPLLAGYLRRLERACEEHGLSAPAIIQSNGGLLDLDTAAAHAALTVLSGPAGGAAGAAFAARAAGVEQGLCFDMGGTSCDVCVIEDSQVAEHAAGTIAGRPIALPTLAIHTVGAGGGSIAWRDAGGALRVGPRSAGADPGPAGYGRGGSEPTVTDANLVLGYLDPDTPLAGDIVLDATAAHTAVATLAEALKLSTEDTARGIRQVACAEMAGALRNITIDRGIDPRDHTLIAFGGAGGLHATDIADELGISSILVPGNAGVLSALGLVIAPERHDAQQTVLIRGAELTARRVSEIAHTLADRASGPFQSAPATIRVRYELRYVGQSFELAVDAGLDPGGEALRDAFEAEHARRYGFTDADAEVELVTIRVSAFGAEPDLELPDPGAATEVSGVVALAETTVLVPEPWRGEMDETGTVRLWTR